MKFLLIILLICLIKSILTDGLSILAVYISILIKGKINNYNSDKWNQYLENISDTFVIKYFLIIYIISSIVSCLLCYLIIQLFSIKYKGIIILSIFIISLIYTIIKFKVKDNNYIISKVKELKKSLKDK